MTMRGNGGRAKLKRKEGRCGKVSEEGQLLEDKDESKGKSYAECGGGGRDRPDEGNKQKWMDE